MYFAVHSFYISLVAFAQITCLYKRNKRQKKNVDTEPKYHTSQKEKTERQGVPVWYL